MVYRGKPSAACGECRKRRNRCDQAIPSCGQCRKAKRKCPGYRNKVDLMFFDESEEVAKRSRSESSIPDQKANDQSRGSSTSDLIVSPRTASRRLPFISFDQSNELAINFFMATYVGTDAINAQFNYLPQHYSQTGYSDPDICDGLKAVGLIGYAKATGRSDIVEIATRSYISAIKSVNKGLSMVDAAQNDSLLLTILLLAMFEVMLRPRGPGLQNITKHLNGAVSIAILRLKQGHQTSLGKKVFGSLYQAVIMNCWLQNIAVPSDLSIIKRQMDRNSMHSDFLEIVMMMMRFRNSQENEKHESPSATIAKALALDEKLKAFEQSMPKDGQFQSISTSPSDLVFEGIYHIYPKNFTAHLWNNLRASRIRIHMVVAAQSSLLLDSPECYQHTFMAAQRSLSERFICSLAKDICASVPQLAGYLDELREPSSDSTDNSKSNLHADTMPATTEAGATLSMALPHILPLSMPTSASTPETSSRPGKQNTTSALLNPKPASQCQLLYQLYTLYQIPTLPINMREWLHDRVDYVSRRAEPEDLRLLHQALNGMPSSTFPFFVNV